MFVTNLIDQAEAGKLGKEGARREYDTDRGM
jgi:hypothetical protein